MLPLPSSGQCHYAVAFSPCGRWLAAGGSAYAVHVWDLDAPQEAARRLPDLTGPIVRAAFANDGRLIAVSTEWIATYAAGTHATSTARRVSGVCRAVVPSDGATVIACDEALRCWAVNGDNARLDWSSAGLLGALSAVPLTDVTVTGNGRVFAARVWPAGGGLLDVRDGVNGDVLDNFPVTGRPHRIACSADGTLAAVLANGNLSVWNLTARKAVADRANPKHGGWLSVAFDPHGRRVVTGGIDGTVAVWEAATDGPPLTTFQWGVGPVYAVTFDRDGLRAAAAGHAGAVVWDVDE